VKASARFVSTVDRFGFGPSKVGGAATRSTSHDTKGIGAHSSRSALALASTLFASVALLLGAAAPAAPAATATDSYGYLSTFGDGTGQHYRSQYNAVAVDGSTGNIFVAETIDGTGEEGAVQIYSPDLAAGGMPLTSVALPVLPLDIALNQADGSMYILSVAGPIDRYLSDGAPVPTYTLDPSFSPPSGLLSENRGGIAVDPVTHDILVGDRGSGSNPVDIYRLDPTGALLSSFDGSNTAAGPFTFVGALAVGPTGTVYVVDDYSGRVERFSPAGASLGKLPIRAGGSPSSLAVNPATGEVAALVSFNGQRFIEGFTAAGEPTFSSRLPAQAFGSPIGLAWDLGTDRLYLDVENGATGTVHTFVPAIQPGVDPPIGSQITPTSVHLEAKVAPGGQKTTARIEYCPATAACANYQVSNPEDESNPWVRLPDHKELEGSGEETITDDLTGLKPNFDYLVRTSAESLSADEKVTTDNTSASTPFHTVPIPPETTTNEATDVSETSAVLNGTINPVDLPTTYHFEYGTTTAYGSRVPAGIEAVAGADRNNKRVGRTITGLLPGTTYHFRLVAQNSAGVNEGADRTFTTAAVGVLHRAYEQVTPVDKGGSAIYEGIGFQAKADGSAISYATQGNSSSAPLAARSMSLRGASDWTGGIVLDPPLNAPGENLIGATTLAVSADFTHTFIATNRKLTSDAVEDGPDRANLYVVDVATGAHTLVGTAPSGLRTFISVQSADNFVAGAPDFSWVVFKSRVALKPGAPENALYRWSVTTGLVVVSVVPHGEMASVAISCDKCGSIIRLASADGSRIYFNVIDSGGLEEGVFLWEEGHQPKAISVSHIPGDPSTPRQAVLVGASKDGRYAFLFSPPGVKLTSDAPDEGGQQGDMYRYDAADDSLTYLGAAAFHSFPLSGDLSTPIGVADDGQTAYWNGPPNSGVLVWRDGAVKTAAPTELRNDSGATPMSPDGRYLAYREAGNVYLYDAETDQRSCVSCLPDGSSGNGFLRQVERFVSNRLEQAVTNSDQVFFTSSARLVAADVNGTEDVYEYKDGKNTLISPGNGPFNARFADISEDGSDVFFTTDQKLVGQDNDETADVYDARIDGGLAKQNPPPPQECLRDDCKATPNAGPELPFGGSEALNGPGNVSGAARKRCAKGSHARKVNGKSRCVKQSKAKKKANTNRRQGL
jgi:hypothetical protein